MNSIIGGSTLLAVAMTLIIALNIFIIAFLSVRLHKAKQEALIAKASSWDDLATGESGDIELEKSWLSKVNEMYHVFCVKQADYGPNNIAVGGETGLALRLGDKVSRAFELTGVRSGAKKKAKVSGEALRDTWMDIADYGVIALIVADGEWKTITPEEAWGSQQ